MKRWIALALSALLLFSVVPFAVAPVSAASAKTMTFAELHGYFRSRGRTVEHLTSFYMDNVASGFEMYYYGSGDFILNATVKCDTDVEIAQYLSVSVDGVTTRMRIECEARGTNYQKALKLASNLPEGYHRIEVLRQTEAKVSLFRADSITFTGTPLATAPESDLIIDVIGDSISGGYGCLWNSSLGVADPNCNHPAYQDGTQSYAFLAGKTLGANVRVTQTSGYGCVAGWNGRNVNLQMMYPLTCWFRSTSFQHTFDPLADVVVINLGTNDYNTRTTNNLTNDEFKAGAKNLMQMAKQYNPGAKVVWCTGMMGNFYTTEVKSAISELGGEAEGFYFLSLPTGMSGAVSHPTAAQQAAAADVLSNFLRESVLTDHEIATTTRDQLRSAIDAVNSTDANAVLAGAVERAEMELAVGTTDPYRLQARLEDIQAAAANKEAAISLMPKQYISTTPTAGDNVSYVWPYYAMADGSVALYKGGDGTYWPQIDTAIYQTMNVNETPYLHIELASTASFNMTLFFRNPDGTSGYVKLSELLGMGDADLAPMSKTSYSLDLAAHLKRQGAVSERGLVALSACEMFVVGSTDQFVRVYDCRITSFGDAPKVITGAYPIKNGILSGVNADMTVEELIAAMDNSDCLTVINENGEPVSGALATGMVLTLTAGGTVHDRAVIAVAGDLNGDGRITSVDARIGLLSLLGADNPLEGAVKVAADFNGDATVSTTDVREMLTLGLQ